MKLNFLRSQEDDVFLVAQGGPRDCALRGLAKHAMQKVVLPSVLRILQQE